MDSRAVDVRAELARIEACLDAFVALREALGDRAGERVPAVSGWSVDEHLYHVALATDLALRNVRSLVAGKGRLIVDEGELGARAAEVLANDDTPRGEAEAPRMVRPPEEIDPALLRVELDAMRETIGRVAAVADEVTGAPRWIPHQLLGPLSAAHWTRFGALHARHHLAIACEVAEALAG